MHIETTPIAALVLACALLPSTIGSQVLTIDDEECANGADGALYTIAGGTTPGGGMLSRDCDDANGWNLDVRLDHFAAMDMLVAKITFQHDGVPAGPEHAADGPGMQTVVTLCVLNDATSNNRFFTERAVVDHGTHFDVYACWLIGTQDVGVFTGFDIGFVVVHTEDPEDGVEAIDPEMVGVGSDGVTPGMSVWGTAGLAAGPGETLFVLVEDVTLDFAVTQPQLMLASAPLSSPADLASVGAPGFWLHVYPQLVFPGQPPTGNHHAEAPLTVPNDPTLVGTILYAQWVLMDPTANALGLTFSDATPIVIAFNGTG